MILALKSKLQEVVDLPPWLGKVTEANHMSEVSLNGGQERPLHKAEKMKPELYCRLQDLRDARCKGKLLTRYENKLREREV